MGARSRDLDVDSIRRYLAQKLGFYERCDPPEQVIKVLEEVNLDGIVKWMKSEQCQNIITMSGAGISTCKLLTCSAAIRLPVNTKIYFFSVLYIFYNVCGCNKACFSSICLKSKLFFLTAAGIPDFRSPETGLYHNLQKYNLPEPQAIFEINFFRQNPKPFFTLAKELFPGKFKPTVSHYFIRLLHEKGEVLNKKMLF